LPTKWAVLSGFKLANVSVKEKPKKVVVNLYK
jgi:hypothetical protein